MLIVAMASPSATSFFARFPAVSLRQLLSLVIPLMLLGPVAWFAIRNEEEAIRRQWQAEVAREPSRVDRIILDAKTLAMVRLEAGAVQGTPLLDYVRVSSRGVLLEPKSQTSYRQDWSRACEQGADSTSARALMMQNPARFAETCGAIRGANGSLLVPFFLVSLEGNEWPALLEPWLANYGDAMRNEERELLSNRIRARASEPTRSRLLGMVRRADTTIVDVESTLQELRSSFNPQASHQTITLPHGTVHLRRRIDDSHDGFLVHYASLERSRSELAIPEGIRMNKREGAAANENGLPPNTLAIGRRMAVQFSLDEALVKRQAARSSLMFRTALVAVTGATIVYAFFLLQQARKRRHLSELQIDYAAALAHEIRTPATTLRLLSDALVPASEEQAEIAETILREAKRLERTIARMLSLRYLSRPGLKATRRRFDLAAKLAQWVTDYPPGTVHFTCARSALIEADEALVETAVTNLLQNAMRYGKRTSGEDNVQEPTTVYLSSTEACVRLEVSDRGPGVADAEKEAIFSAFARGKTRLTEATDGAGIGLALVRLCAELHGGRALVVDREGSGATFILELPSAPANTTTERPNA
jgi:signal transduction histidine kinase